MAFNNNVLDFPLTNNKLYKTAIKAYKQGNYRQALELSISLINNGDAYANTLAGAIYEKGGNGVNQDLDKAFFYYQKAVDEIGSVEGWLALGRFYYFGKSVAQDYEKAFNYYSIVAEDTENSVAYLVLGKMYLEGNGVNKNLPMAREYLKKAIKSGSVFGYTYLGMLEKESGHIFYSFLLRIKAGVLAFFITHINANDSRLRRY